MKKRIIKRRKANGTALKLSVADTKKVAGGRVGFPGKRWLAVGLNGG